MIELSTGAVLDKELLITDFSDGRKYGPRLGWLSTFHPCRICRNEKCRRQTYEPCDKAYFELWKKKFLDGGAQGVLEQWGMKG